jgi:glycerol-3-phosphate acyltransferase PlsY
LGSIPSAFILYRYIYDGDIREKGTGNIGTLNFFRISKSISISIIVLLLDVAKGYFAIWLCAYFLYPSYLILPALCVLLGHIYPVWLKGKGGRGLATLAGIFLFVQPILVAFWWVFFILIYLLVRKYIISAMIALFLINIITGIFYPINEFLILSASSILVFLNYRQRLQDELSS